MGRNGRNQMRAATGAPRDTRRPAGAGDRRGPAPAGRASGNGTAKGPRPSAQRPVRASERPAAAAQGESQQQRRMRYIPALDGLRTLAVAAVVLYHLNLTWAQGGLLGVTMFFVLSGYLITRLLIAEFDQSGGIDLKSFWIRRIRRLVPATLAVVLVTIVLCTIFNHVMLTKMRPDIIPSLLFANNWWQIIHQVSYFNAVGDPSPLTHFWSLAIEEQFYLVWPPVLFLLLKLGTGKTAVRRIALVLAAVSAVAMIVLYDPGVDPSRLYYGTDTRAFSLLLGAWLAFIPERSMAPGRLLKAIGIGGSAGKKNDAPRNDEMDDAELAAINAAAPSSYTAASKAGTSKAAAKPRMRGAQGEVAPEAEASSATWQLDVIGVIGLVGLGLMVVFTNGYTSFQYQGGTLLCSVLTLMVIAACVQQGGMLARVLSAPPLVWLGKRSYSIYLWHFPLLTLMNPVSNISQVPWWMLVVQVGVVVLAAELSYHFIETPFRHGAFGEFMRRMHRERLSLPEALLARPLPSAIVGIMLLIAIGGLVFVPDTSALSEEGAEVLNAETTAEQPADTGESSDGSVTMNEDGFPEGSYDILMIGDSVSLRAVPEFESVFPHGHIDAAKNRQFAAGEEMYVSYAQQNLAGKIVVFALGTNGLVTDDAIDSLMSNVGDSRIVVFVNTRSPQPWVQATNTAIAGAADRYDNVRLIDWYSYSADKGNLFDGDGTHLSSEGAKQYVNLIYEAVKEDLPLHPEDHANDPEVVTAREAAQAVLDALFLLDTEPLNPPEE